MTICSPEKRVIALGFFDGVHLGHAALLSKASSKAAEIGACPSVLTYDNHPETLITGQKVPLICTAYNRAELIRERFMIQEVIFSHFDRNLMETPWQHFISDFLAEKFSAIHVVAGHDFHFGYKGEGNPERLVSECGKLGIGCDIVGRVELDGITISSTYIRKLIAQGDMERAAEFLGYPHRISGVVRHGQKIGSSFGFPTVNLDIPDEIQMPSFGVYITNVMLNGKRYPSVTNIGVNPTMSRNIAPRLESTLLDFGGNLYGKKISVELLRYIRPESDFQSASVLKEHIVKDVEIAKAYFSKKQ